MGRYLATAGWKSVRNVGQSGDGGADVIATINDRRWLIQVKKYKRAIGESVISETVNAVARYDAHIPVIVSSAGFTLRLREAVEEQRKLGVPIQLWDAPQLERMGRDLPEEALIERRPDEFQLRPYQEEACDAILQRWLEDPGGSALVVLATGLGKTFVAASALRRIASQLDRPRVLVLAHTNPLLIQLEREFWPFLKASERTLIANGDEKFEWNDLSNIEFVFASRDTVVARLNSGDKLPEYDVVLVDECHHLLSASYDLILDELRIDSDQGPFLIGLTATDWRPNGQSLEGLFGDPIIRIDLVDALRGGFLANVDYRMYTDNIDWDSLSENFSGQVSPKRINRTLFIREWDDAVVEHVHEAWNELKEDGVQPRGIVFCSTKEHARRIAAQINALQFTRAEVLYSGSGISIVDRYRTLWEFADGKTGIICAVDIFNEGIDVPDVNLIVFQRVTHSRRIFVQQLGRGLRLAPGKKRVIVLDFVNDVRRFAEGLKLQDGLPGQISGSGETLYIRAGDHIESGSRFSFRRANSDDSEGASFLRQWLGDIENLNEVGEDVSILTYPDPSIVPHGRTVN